MSTEKKRRFVRKKLPVENWSKAHFRRQIFVASIAIRRMNSEIDHLIFILCTTFDAMKVRRLKRA